MSDDISRILREWEFDPNTVTTRVIRGEDGRERVQLRVDLGLLQMEMDGRPDGLRPENHESWFEYYQRLQEAHDEAHLDSPPFELDRDACQRLWIESVQYYHRYLCFWHLRKYELCARDTRRNLRLFAFVREHARNDRAKLQFDQWRPYVLMMHARAVATPLAALREFDAAIVAVESSIDGINEFIEEYQQEDRADECAELVELQKWHQSLVRERDSFLAARGERTAEMLRRKLQEAVESEEFEEAARIRDEIRRLDSGDGTRDHSSP
ncbi:MAG: hypothetical protein GX621_03070 [Pirellulaceae bacterium]|nr:hypothetical protein [Pirellulaceae bacterium]